MTLKGYPRTTTTVEVNDCTHLTHLYAQTAITITMTMMTMPPTAQAITTIISSVQQFSINMCEYNFDVRCIGLLGYG